jgi:hypothetical protein
MRTISLRKFRTEVADLTDQVEVTRRDSDGNIHLLGFWTPYAAKSDQVQLPVRRLEIPVPEPTGPKIVRTPEEAAAAVPARGEPYPKEQQAGRRRKR